MVAGGLYEIWANVMLADGTKSGNDWLVSSASGINYQRPRIQLLSNWDLGFVWFDDTNKIIRAKIYSSKTNLG